MPDNDPFRKYIDAGMVFTHLTRQRAEEIVRELIHSGEVNRDQAARWVEELLERSRQSTELLLGVVRKELDDRIAQLNLVTRDDLANLAARITGGVGRRGAAPGARRASTAAAPAGGGARARATTAAGTDVGGARGARATKAASTRTAAKTAAGTKAASTRKSGTKTAGATKAASTKTAAGASKATAAKKAPAAMKTKPAGVKSPSTRGRKA